MKTKNTKQIFEEFILSKQIPLSIVREYKFSIDRKYRFDYAYPEHKIAIELEGGIHKFGRHNRSQGYTNDCNKYNLAVLNNWKILRYTIDNIDNVLEDIKKMFPIIEIKINNNTEKAIYMEFCNFCNQLTNKTNLIRVYDEAEKKYKQACKICILKK